MKTVHSASVTQSGAWVGRRAIFMPRCGRRRCYCESIREGKICCIKVGRAYRIPKAHLFTYLCIGC